MIRQVFHRGSMQYLIKKGVQKRHTLNHYNALLPTRVALNCTQNLFALTALWQHIKQHAVQGDTLVPP